MRTPRPLKAWELQREKDEYAPPSLTDQEKEDIKIKYGHSFYGAYYDWAQDAAAYLSEDDQRAYFDEITRLARRNPQDPEIQMVVADRTARDHEQEFREVAAAMHFKRYSFLTPEQKTLFKLVSSYRSLSPEEQRRIGEKESALGVDLLPEKKRNLFKRWAKNKYRGNWFEITMKIIDLAEDGFFDEHAKADLLKRAHALKDKINTQRANRKKNQPEDVSEGDALIQKALEQLFPSIMGLEDEDRKKELGKLLGIVIEGNP